MKWPWTEHLEHLRNELDRERTLSTQMSLRLTMAEDRYTQLLEKYHGLRLSGGSSALPMVPKEADPVTLAILAKSRGNPALHRHYAEVVADRRAARVAGFSMETEDDLAHAIMHGDDDSDGVPL